MNWAFKGRTRSRARFPLPMEDLLTALQHVGSQTDGGLILGGASAGACLAASTAFRAVEMDLDLRGAIFTYGFFHAEHPRAPEIQRRVRGHRRLTHARWVLNVLNRNYAGSEVALRDRLAFPGGHDLSGFPSTLMINADNDVMRASGDQFAAELRGARVDVEHHILTGSRHAFLNQPRLDDFAKAIDLMASWCTDAMANEGASHRPGSSGRRGRALG
ncbi:alpha/beta hydrolase [Paenarthrobacter sp. NPDC089714]|uniref:alpha/beta hydrolase n=1 Tax=Paenarthrobacter sp. NPDC089714 TaxID=3364377 RepID=UPI00380CDFDD